MPVRWRCAGMLKPKKGAKPVLLISVFASPKNLIRDLSSTLIKAKTIV
jgi:hypothetical protein